MAAFREVEDVLALVERWILNDGKMFLPWLVSRFRSQCLGNPSTSRNFALAVHGCSNLVVATFVMPERHDHWLANVRLEERMHFEIDLAR